MQDRVVTQGTPARWMTVFSALLDAPTYPCLLGANGFCPDVGKRTQVSDRYHRTYKSDARDTLVVYLPTYLTDMCVARLRPSRVHSIVQGATDTHQAERGDRARESRKQRVSASKVGVIITGYVDKHPPVHFPLFFAFSGRISPAPSQGEATNSARLAVVADCVL